jgi:hypothetical protein
VIEKAYPCAVLIQDIPAVIAKTVIAFYLVMAGIAIVNIIC